MTIALQPIYTQTVGSGGVVNVVFNNIPQTFTDLMVVVNTRTSNSNDQFQTIGMNFSSGYPAPSTFTFVSGYGNSTASSRSSQFMSLGTLNDGSTTANTFSSHTAYIPNYTSSNFKQVIVDAVTENNAVRGVQSLYANLCRQTAPVTSMSFDVGGNLFVQNSTFSLYGITKG